VLYVSWNGATTVRRWQVLTRHGSERLRPLMTAPDRGFETRITVRSAAGSFVLRALGGHDHVLGQSLPVASGPG
jgi:hypothetical protein